jgi:hypothetical protein
MCKLNGRLRRVLQSQQSSSNGMQGLTIINQIEQDDLVGGI